MQSTTKAAITRVILVYDTVRSEMLSPSFEGSVMPGSCICNTFNTGTRISCNYHALILTILVGYIHAFIMRSLNTYTNSASYTLTFNTNQSFPLIAMKLSVNI